VPAATVGGTTPTPEQREAILKEAADFWWKTLSRPQAGLDEGTFRDTFLRAFSPPGGEKGSSEKK